MTEADEPRRRLLATIETEHAAWRTLVAEVGEDRMTEPGPMGTWTFRDLLVHLLGWRDRTLARLEAVAAGQPEPPSPWPPELDGDDDGDDDDGVDAVNEWFQDRGAERSVAELLAVADASYGRLGAALAAIPVATLTDPLAIPWLDGEAAVDVDWLGHLNDEHMPSIRAWLDGERGASPS